MAENTSKTGRWQRILLVGSLALNLVIVGIVAGSLLSGGSKNSQTRIDLTVGPLTRAMNTEDRDEVRAVLRDSGVFRPGDREGIRMDMQALVDVLKADDFDADAFRDTLIRQRARLQAGQDRVLEAVARQIEGMTPDARAAFADRLEQQVRRGPPRRED